MGHSTGQPKKMCFQKKTFLQASCDLTKMGDAGDPSKKNAICQLNQNPLNQYIFLILWFWFVVLSVVGFLQLCFETLTVIPKFRIFLIKWMLPPIADEKRKSSQNTVKRYVKDLEIGDWFLLYQIGKNMDKHFFDEFIEKISTAEPAEIQNCEPLLPIEEIPPTDVEEGNPINSEENSNIVVTG